MRRFGGAHITAHAHSCEPRDERRYRPETPTRQKRARRPFTPSATFPRNPQGQATHTKHGRNTLVTIPCPAPCETPAVRIAKPASSARRLPGTSPELPQELLTRPGPPPLSAPRGRHGAYGPTGGTPVFQISFKHVYGTSTRPVSISRFDTGRSLSGGMSPLYPWADFARDPLCTSPPSLGPTPTRVNARRSGHARNPPAPGGADTKDTIPRCPEIHSAPTASR